jgi:ABC-type lipoprotein release transport system permease subunit
MKKINLYLLDYAINFILRDKYKNIFISVSLTLLTFILTTIFVLSSSIKYELQLCVDQIPDIVIQNQKAGIRTFIDEKIVDDIFEINGVKDVKSRVWGYYNFKKAGVNFSLLGVDELELEKYDVNRTSMLIGIGVSELLKEYYYDSYFNFIKENGEKQKIDITEVLPYSTQLESNNLIIMNKDTLKDIYGLKENEAVDIVVEVYNKNEVPTIAYKLQDIYQNMNIITKDDIKAKYENLFDYKSGIFLSIFIISIFTFFIIIYDKVSGVSGSQKHEIGVLKAVGWRVEDILKAKMYEGIIISMFSYIIGVSMAYIYVYILKAPLFKDIFIGKSPLNLDFTLPFIFDIKVLFIIFLLSVPIYIAAIIIPSWRLSTMDSDEVMR